MYIFLCHCSLGPPMALFKLYIGGVWTGYGHNEVAQWLWESTSIQPLSIRLYSKGADATKQSAFVGYPTEGLARQALAILKQRPSMWGSRVTVLWSRDNPTTTADPDKATAPAASPSSTSSRLLEASNPLQTKVCKLPQRQHTKRMKGYNVANLLPKGRMYRFHLAKKRSSFQKVLLNKLFW